MMERQSQLWVYYRTCRKPMHYNQCNNAKEFMQMCSMKDKWPVKTMMLGMVRGHWPHGILARIWLSNIRITVWLYIVRGYL